MARFDKYMAFKYRLKNKHSLKENAQASGDNKSNNGKDKEIPESENVYEC